MSTTTTHGGSRTAVSTKQKVGLVIAALYSVGNIPNVLTSSPAPGEVGPPMSVLAIGSVLGVVGVVAAVLAWRGNRVALRVCAGALVVMTLTGLPAFFVDVPMAVKALVAASVVITVVAIVLMFSGDRRAAAVVD